MSPSRISLLHLHAFRVQICIIPLPSPSIPHLARSVVALIMPVGIMPVHISPDACPDNESAQAVTPNGTNYYYYDEDDDRRMLDEKKSYYKDHPVSLSHRLRRILTHRPYLIWCTVGVILAGLIWLMMMPNPPISTGSTVTDRVSVQPPTTQTPATTTTQTESNPIPTTPIEVKQQQQQPPTPAQPPVQQQQQQPSVVATPPKSTPPSTPQSQEHAPSSHTASLHQADLIDDDLYCRSTASRTGCDWRWGPSTSNSANSEDHAGEELDPKAGNYTRPQDFYTYQAGIQVTGEGPGAIVRIKM